MESGYKYYRPVYSLFATLTLIAILFYQFMIPSNDMLVIPTWMKWMVIPLGMDGLIFMWKSIRKYFYYLSGIDVVVNNPVESKLETSGLHSWVRHPLYFGTLTVIWCLFVWMPTFANGIACLLITMYIMVGIRLEEKKLIEEFGDAYRIYRQQVSMIVPGLPRRNSKRRRPIHD
jgi:protein-S-isoprenylcysteine O-methyltransferase Ste14